MKGEAAVSVDAVNPLRNMLSVKMKSFKLSKILSAFNISPPSSISNILNDITINKMIAQLVPVGGVKIGDNFYD